MKKELTELLQKDMDKYLQTVARMPLLTEEEQNEVKDKIKVGDIEADLARERLVQSNLRFVVSIANPFQNKGLSLVELLIAGNNGLQQAAEKYDPSRGYRFISFAVWYIRTSIEQELASITTDKEINGSTN